MPAATAPAVDFVLLGGKVVDGSGTPRGWPTSLSKTGG